MWFINLTIRSNNSGHPLKKAQKLDNRNSYLKQSAHAQHQDTSHNDYFYSLIEVLLFLYFTQLIQLCASYYTCKHITST